MFIKIFVILFFYYTGIESSRKKNSYEYHPEVKGWLKLHTEPADWQTARMNCHDENAILAAPWTEVFESTLVKMLRSEQNELPKAIFVGIHSNFPEGVYKYHFNGTAVLSQDPTDVEEQSLDRCGAYYANGMGTLVDCRLHLAYVCHAPASASSVCGKDSLDGYELDERTGNCYKFHSKCVFWDEAHRICQDEGAHLAIINSDVEANVLTDLFAKYPLEKLINADPHWNNVTAVGFYYWKNADTYLTTQGQTLKQAGYEKWDNNQPSTRNTNAELRGGMFRNGLLDDLTKYLNVPFICEKKPIQTDNIYQFHMPVVV